MTFNAASRLRSLEDRRAALGSSRCELPGMHSVPKSAVLPYASGVGGLSRRLLNKYGDRFRHGWFYKLGSPSKGIEGSFEGVWGVIQGRFRADPYKSYLAVSTNGH